jgi:glycosyltransferase involved in cell wall biosynthesis
LAPELMQGEFVLHVGSNLRRKNREGVLRIFARTAEQWNGRLVFAGDPLTDALRSLAHELHIEHRLLEISRPTNEQLEALYNRALALVYPSRFEGFGWPILEAQACGCPVICTNAAPMSDVAGEAGLLREVDDEAGFAADILRLTQVEERRAWSARSLANAAKFSTATMIEKYCELYRSLGAKC